MLLNTAKTFGPSMGVSGLSGYGYGSGPAKSTVRPTRLPGMAGMWSDTQEGINGAGTYVTEKLRVLAEQLGADVQKCDSRFYGAWGPLPILNPFYFSNTCANFRKEIADVNARMAGRSGNAGAPGLTMPTGPAGANPLDNNPDKAELDRATNQKTADWLKNYFDGVYVPPEDETGTGGDPDEKRPGEISMWVWVGIAGIGLLALGNKR